MFPLWHKVVRLTDAGHQVGRYIRMPALSGCLLDSAPSGWFLALAVTGFRTVFSAVCIQR